MARHTRRRDWEAIRQWTAGILAIAVVAGGLAWAILNLPAHPSGPAATPYTLPYAGPSAPTAGVPTPPPLP